MGYGVPSGGDQFAIKQRGGPVRVPGSGFHIEFAADDREAVVRFHPAAPANGGGRIMACRSCGRSMGRGILRGL